MSLFTKKQSDIPRRRLAGRDVRPPAITGIFKRNRTLTGTTSNHFDSTNVKSDLESSRTHAHHLSIKRGKVVSILIVVIVSGVLLWTLISNFTATVTASVSSTAISKSVDLSKYEKVIQEYLDANPLSRLHFLLDRPALTAFVSSKSPEVADVSQQDMMGVGETGFVVTMRVPVAGWKIDGKQYYVDSKGIPFEQNYFTATPVVQIVDSSGSSLKTGATAIVSNRFLSFVGRVVAQAKTSGYTVSEAILPANTTRELGIRLKGSSVLVKLSIDRPVGEQVEDMSRSLKYFVSQSLTPSYIDVRVSGKAFYK